MKKVITVLSTVASIGVASFAVANDHQGNGEGNMQKGKHHNFAEQMFKRMDSNNDGVVSKAEFSDHTMKRFDKMDADGNGEISEAEAKDFREDMKEKRKEMKEKHREPMRDKADDADE